MHIFACMPAKNRHHCTCGSPYALQGQPRGTDSIRIRRGHRRLGTLLVSWQMFKGTPLVDAMAVLMMAPSDPDPDVHR